MTALLQRRPRAAATVVAETPNRVLLTGIDWQAYCTMADALPERKIRFTYDRGALEIMTVSFIHDRLKTLLPFLVLAIAEEVQRDIACCGSFTHRRKDLERAIEPDSCFYIANIKTVLGKKHIDLEKDLPPDLALEVEISRSLMDRLSILEALGVGEVWRLDEERIRVLVLRESGYAEVAQSPSFPEISMEDIPRLLAVGIERGELTMVKAFRTWFRKHKKKSKK